MIPARTTCPRFWTKEYYGYLMSAHIDHGRSTFECVDKDQNGVSGSINGSLFYHVEVTCGSIPCSRYDSEKELNCVVCTR